ncbi:MAG TPA: hypothetical protein VF721_23125 [Pyrinomonadaceae bacterium]|jgi:hypothetical protein
MFIAELTKKRALYRKFQVLSPHGTFEVVYNGGGMGYEEILVDGETACRRNSYFWYVSDFEFKIGGADAKITVRVWIWLQIRSFNFEIEGESVYSE